VTPPTPTKSLPVATAEPWFKPDAPAAQQIQTPAPQASPEQATPQPPPEPAKAVAAQEDVKAKRSQDDKPKQAADDTKAKTAQDEAKAKAAQDEAKAKSRLERVAKKAKRKPKLDPDGDGMSTVASTNDDDVPDTRASRTSKQPRRIVERWTEREYARPSDNGGQRVIRRGGGGFFENLFGMGRPGEDD
jgi:hypothetical protein